MSTNKKYGIRLDNVSKRFGPIKALESVTVDFQPKMIHGLIGPEGAGKTTLLRTMLSLLKTQTGSITFYEQDNQVPFGDIRSLIAYMPQQQSLYPDLSISEHLDFFKDLYGISNTEYKTKRETLLKLTRLTEFQNRSAGKLSGGMYKKLGLICALLRSPSIMLLDEPTNGVDPISRREFWDLIYELAQQGLLIILTTAYMDEAERCTDIHLLSNGRIIASGEPSKLISDFSLPNIDAIFTKLAGDENL